MDQLDVEGETQVGTISEADLQKTIPGKSPAKAKSKETSRSPLFWLIPILILALVVMGGMQYFHLRQEIDGLQQLNKGLRSEIEAKGKAAATLNKELKAREEALQQAQAEGNQYKGQADTIRLALMERDAQIARLQQTADFRTKLPKKVRDLQSQLVQKQIENVSLQKTVSDQAEWLRVLALPSSQVVRMTGSKEAGSAGGFVAFDAGGQAAFYGFNLPKPPAGKVYQLWTVGKMPVSAGLFQPSGERTAVVKMPKWTGEVRQFSVTVEPSGGSRQPTGPATLVGAIGGVSPS